MRRVVPDMEVVHPLLGRSEGRRDTDRLMGEVVPLLQHARLVRPAPPCPGLPRHPSPDLRPFGAPSARTEKGQSRYGGMVLIPPI